MREEFGAQDPRSWMLRFHTQTCGVTLMAQQINNNIVRVTVQALAAILGGTQSLHTNSRDEALALPTEESVRIALRTQQILALESGVADTIDPLAGSYYVENLTNDVEQRAQKLIDRIDELGGALIAVEQGFMQREIEESAYREQRRVETGDQPVVGVNIYRIEEDERQQLLRVDPAVQRRQAARLANLRAERDNEAVGAALAGLREAALGTENLMPHIVRSAEAYATLGEIAGTLAEVFG